MADLDYYGADYGAETPSRLSEALKGFGWVNWAGAVTSVGLAGGMAIWAVDLTFRDVSNVPVIAALEGPMREAPENPGGTQAPFQGMALSDITSGGAAAPAPEEIVLAPPPLTLEAPSLAERREVAGVEAPAPLDPVEQALAPAADAETPIATPAPVDVAALAEALTPEDGALQELVGASAPTTGIEGVTDTALTPEADTEVFNGPGLARSIRPAPRPAALRRAAAPATTAVPTDAPAAGATQEVASLAPVANGLDVDPSTIAPGTRVVQLGAYDSEAAARGEWDRLHARFRDYMGDKRRLVQKARSGGRDFWRLRVVGFDDGSEARRFCSALLAKDAACIPVTVR